MKTANSKITKGKYGFFLTVPRGEVRILQLTDIQIIDSDQMRTPDRLVEAERLKWTADKVWHNAYRYVKEAADRAKPHLIVITGDNVYGEFDDSGDRFREFCEYFERLGIPWAPVFGNHDNQTKCDVISQCEYMEGLKNCLFMHGNVTGNGNYAVTLVRPSSEPGENNGEGTHFSPLRTLLMLDSHGCLHHPGIRADQIGLCREALKEVEEKTGTVPPLFACYHIPSYEFCLAAEDAGYQKADDFWAKYDIGVTVPAKNGDFGKRDDPQGKVGDNSAFMEFFKANGGDGIFVGHYHKNSTSILSGGVRYTFGLKTGLYDYHNDDMVGSTLITLKDPEDATGAPDFSVKHLYTAFSPDDPA
ncbi:MAG: metallophosphoesterase [Clostridia bacterium]|nr:metallophosphoesterase [Clostridia bacterium]